MNTQATRLIELLQLEKKGSKKLNAKVISVASGKGGTGKTFFASNFAFALSKLEKKILLIDFDFNLSNLNIVLNQSTKNSLSEFFEQKKSIEELIQPYTKNLHLIYGDSGKEFYPKIHKEIIDYFFVSLNKVADNYDYIIIDSSAGANELTIRQLINSDFIIIVTTPEPTAIMDAYVLTKMLKAENSSSLKLVVVNKCSQKEEGENSFNNLLIASKHFLQEEPKYIGSVSFDILAHKSILNQELLLENYFDSNISKEIIAITKRFTEIVQVANNNQSNFSQ
ncbi:MAG: AAA family ATPase [Melioribacteraceae bacterium]|nr:AAA family ATPase [Melioribacteraceae bacterium]